MQRLRQLFAADGRMGDWKKHLRWMAAKTRPYIRRLMLLLLLDLLLTFVGVGVTLINKRLIDGASAGTSLDVLGFVVLIVGTVVSVAVGALIGYLSALIRERYAFGVREQVYDRMLRSDWRQVSAYHSEDLLTRMTTDVGEVSGGIAELLPNTIYLLIRILVSFGVLYYFEPFLALTILVLGPVGVLASALFGGRLRRHQRALRDNESLYRAFMQENTAGIAMVKAFEREDYCADMLTQLWRNRLVILKKRGRVNFWMRIVTNGIFSLGYVTAFAWGIYRLSQSEITYGTLSVFLALGTQIQGPIMSLSSLIPKAASVFASAGRVMEMEAMDTEKQEAGEPLQGPLGIRLRRVRFSYDKEEVLHQVSMDIPPGAHVGLVGESGAGKTTIARLLLGLITPDRGTAYLYDAQGARQPLGAYSRRYLSYVAQGNTLVSGTIRSNLQIGDPDADDAAMWEALSVADAGFVATFPDGLDTQVSEGGGAVSEGQAQRIAIARAILRRRDILILDEATSALDLATEETIIHNLRREIRGMTCVVISHRTSLLHLCERRYRVEEGILELVEDED